MNGQNAKTNFPNYPSHHHDDQYLKPTTDHDDGTSANTTPMSPKALSELLSLKLKKSCKDYTSPSLTCLRLDNDNSHIGVWQKRSGSRGISDWVMKIEFGNKKTQDLPQNASSLSLPFPLPSWWSNVENTNSSEVTEKDQTHDDEENKIAMQMIEELLNWNYPK